MHTITIHYILYYHWAFHLLFSSFVGLQQVMHILAIGCAFLSASLHCTCLFFHIAALQVGKQAHPKHCYQVLGQDNRYS